MGDEGLGRILRALEAFDAMGEKYFDLVHLARADPDPPDHVRPHLDDIESRYPDDVRELRDPERGGWTHGFNSGMLAAIKFMSTAVERGPDEAKDEFPELDT